MNIEPDEVGDDPNLDEWLGRIERAKPSHCPKCGSEKVKRIVYGMPVEEDPTPVEERDYVIEGRSLDLDSPGWYCGGCGHRW